MKNWQKILLGVAIVLVGITVARNAIIQGAITVGVPQVLGTPIHIDSLQVGIFRPVVHIKGIKIYNPPGFPKEPFIDIAEVKVEYNLVSILTRNLHLPVVVLKLNEVVVVKDKDGKLNVDSLKIAQTKDQAKAPAAGVKTPAQKTEIMPMQIDLLVLDLGKVVVKDFGKGEPPQVLAYDVGVHNKTYKDIKSAQQLATLILLEAMRPAGIKSAGIYAAATVLGVAFLPAGVAGMLIGKDSGTAEYNADFTKVFQKTKEVLEEKGKSVTGDEEEGTFKANISGADVNVAIVKKTAGTMIVTVSARKYLMPKPEIAQGILYQLEEKLK